MSSPALPFAVLSGLVLAALALGLLALFRARALVRAAGERATAGQAQSDAALAALRGSLDGLAAQLHDLQQQPPLMAVPALPRPGFNLGKRPQALRMHRRGDPPQQIAAALQVPLQEVDLLLKVHRIVLTNL